MPVNASRIFAQRAARHGQQIVLAHHAFDPCRRMIGAAKVGHIDVNFGHVQYRRLLTREQYTQWLAVAARYARRKDEAQDLLHDALLAVSTAQRSDLSDPHNRAWLTGLIRNKAKMDARTAVRRRTRETLVARNRRPPPALSPPVDTPVLNMVKSLPPATRAVATLALHGMTRAEIAFVLRLSDVALRQRLATLRRKWAGVSDSMKDEAIEQVRHRRRTLGRELELGTMRRTLLALVRDVEGIGTHDPDGHLIIFDPKIRSRGGSPRQRQI